MSAPRSRAYSVNPKAETRQVTHILRVPVSLHQLQWDPGVENCTCYLWMLDQDLYPLENQVALQELKPT